MQHENCYHISRSPCKCLVATCNFNLERQRKENFTVISLARTNISVSFMFDWEKLTPWIRWTEQSQRIPDTNSRYPLGLTQTHNHVPTYVRIYTCNNEYYTHTHTHTHTLTHTHKTPKPLILKDQWGTQDLRLFHSPLCMSLTRREPFSKECSHFQAQR